MSFLNYNHYYVINGEETMKPIDSTGFCVNKWNRIKPLLEDLKGINSILDVGCSDGFFSFESSKALNSKCYGIDPDSERIAHANFIKEYKKDKLCSFNIGDLYSISNSSDYDLVLALGLLHRLPDLELAISKIAALGKNILLEFKCLNCDEEKKVYIGQQKSNKENILHYIPSIAYVRASFKRLGYSYFNILKDDSNLKYKRCIMLIT